MALPSTMNFMFKLTNLDAFIGQGPKGIVADANHFAASLDSRGSFRVSIYMEAFAMPRLTIDTN